MTDTVSISARRGESIESFVAALRDAFELAPTEIGGVCIRTVGERWISLNPNPYAEIEEPESVAAANRLLGGPTTSFTLTTTNMHLLRQVLLRLADRDDLVLDTQHGMIVRLHEFAALIRARPTWDWRQ